MSLIIFSCELVSCILWSNYLYKNVNALCSIIFCLMPIPLMFGFLHSSDIIFYLVSSIFILQIKNYFNYKNYIIYILILFLVLTRPAGIIFAIFSIYYFYKKKDIINISISLIIILLTLIYYAPYYIYEQWVLTCPGGECPDSDFHLISFINNYLLKFILLFGFIKSDSGNLYIYIARCGCAIIFILGYFISLTKRNTNDLIIINMFVFSIVLLFYPAYRYILPIVPLLFMYNFIFFFDFYKNLKKYK